MSWCSRYRWTTTESYHKVITNKNECTEARPTIWHLEINGSSFLSVERSNEAMLRRRRVIDNHITLLFSSIATNFAYFAAIHIVQQRKLLRKYRFLNSLICQIISPHLHVGRLWQELKTRQRIERSKELKSIIIK